MIIIGKVIVLRENSLFPFELKNRLVIAVGSIFTVTVVVIGFLCSRESNAQESIVFLSSTLPFEPVVSSSAAAPEDESVPTEISNDEALLKLLAGVNTEVEYQLQEPHTQWQVIRMRVTGYCGCSKCCGKFSDGVTADNHRICSGDTFVAADKFYAFGTQMIIPGYSNDRTVEVKDRGKAIKGNRLDVFFHSHAEAQKWGVKYLDVLVKIN